MSQFCVAPKLFAVSDSSAGHVTDKDLAGPQGANGAGIAESVAELLMTAAACGTEALEHTTVCT